MENNQPDTKTQVAEELSDGATLGQIQLEDAAIKLKDAVRENKFQKRSRFTRVAVALALHTFIIIYLVAFGYLLLEPILELIFKWNISGYNEIEGIYNFFSITLIPVLITSLAIISRFSNTISKITESFAKSSGSDT